MATETTERLTGDGLLEEAADAASYCDDGATAGAILDRGKRAAAALALLPEGWYVVRGSRRDFLRAREGEPARWEVEFALYDGDDERDIARPSVRFSSRAGEYYVHGGPQRGHFEADEATARAVVLLLAAVECERRNA